MQEPACYLTIIYTFFYNLSNKVTSPAQLVTTKLSVGLGSPYFLFNIVLMAFDFLYIRV